MKVFLDAVRFARAGWNQERPALKILHWAGFRAHMLLPLPALLLSKAALNGS